MREPLLIVVAFVAGDRGGRRRGIALASHVTTVDPATVPVGFLAAHNRVADVPVSAFARAAAANGAEVTVQHIRLAPNQPIPWHTHPGPGIALIQKGTFTYESAQGSKCIRTTYEAGSGFIDPGFGNVHQAVAGPRARRSTSSTCCHPEAQTSLILTDPDPACTS